MTTREASKAVFEFRFFIFCGFCFFCGMRAGRSTNTVVMLVIGAIVWQCTSWWFVDNYKILGEIRGHMMESKDKENKEKL